jgi:hypothetical protein
MSTLKYLLAAMLPTVLSSCGEQPAADKVRLTPAEKIVFPLDANTKSFILALFPYTDGEGKEYLTFQNQGQNEILFYDMPTQRLEFKVTPAHEGPHGVGSVLGYYVHNLDSIYLTAAGVEELALIDSSAAVKNKIVYDKTGDGTALHVFYSVSSRYHPIVVLNNQLYILSGCNRRAEVNPVCATIDRVDETVRAFRSYEYPSFPGADNKAKRAGAEEYFSRCFDGKRFVYSFYFKEDIDVVSVNHEDIETVKVKSRYIDKVKQPDDYGNVTPEGLCANPNYGNLLYDEYRDVYYRVAYPATDIEEGVRGMELLQYGRKRFSIIILDSDFHIIGETLMPDYTYNSDVMFIRRDGLYISESHYLNPEYSDDELSFRRFVLTER